VTSYEKLDFPGARALGIRAHIQIEVASIPKTSGGVRAEPGKFSFV
jgi:hypothetical protein